MLSMFNVFYHALSFVCFCRNYEGVLNKQLITGLFLLIVLAIVKFNLIIERFLW